MERYANSSFDEQIYLVANPDVAETVIRGEFASGFDHYRQFGEKERRVTSSPAVRFESIKINAGALHHPQRTERQPNSRLY